MTDKVCETKPKRQLPNFDLLEGDVKNLKDLTIDQEVELKIMAKVKSVNRESYNDNKVRVGFAITEIEMMKVDDGKKIKQIKSTKNLEELAKEEEEMQEK